MKIPLSKTRKLEIKFDSFMPRTVFDWILVGSFVFAMAWAIYAIGDV
jgi:hypothetical protein